MNKQRTKRMRRKPIFESRRESIDLSPWASGTVRDALGDSGIRLVTREPVTRWRRISRRRFNKMLRNVGKTTLKGVSK